MKRLVLLCIVVPNLCFASIDVRMLYIKAVADFSTCGNALMPWGGKGLQPDEVEQPYVLQAKTNRTKMQAEIDKEFYTEANLEKLFVALTNDFYEKTTDITARLIRDKLASDFRLHAEIIQMCSDDVNKSTN